MTEEERIFHQPELDVWSDPKWTWWHLLPRGSSASLWPPGLPVYLLLAGTVGDLAHHLWL